MKTIISQRESLNEFGDSIECLEARYVQYFESFGLKLQSCSNFSETSVNLIDSNIQFIILTGGGAAPSDYFINSHGEFEQLNRNKTELLLIKKSIQLNIPIIAICRGFQFINGYLGGKIDDLKYTINRPINKEHLIALGKNQIFVNNYHNHGIPLKLLAQGLNIIGLDSENNHVEAVYNSQFRWLGLQWHPEREVNDSFSRNVINELIRDFVNNKGVIDESYYSCSRPGH